MQRGRVVHGNSLVLPKVSLTHVGRWTRSCAALAAVLVASSGCADRAVVPERAAARDPAAAAAPVTNGDANDAGTDGGAAPVDAHVPPDAPRRARSTPEDAGRLFDPRDDDAVIERLRTQEIVAVERGRGGRSVAFRFMFGDGTRAYFKPEQTFSGTHWYAEIAAFHLDRLLRVHRTAPSTGRVVPFALLEPALAGDSRASELIVQDDGTVRGAIIAWIDERLVPIRPPAGWERALRLSETAPVYPFVAPVELRRALAARDAGVDAATDAAVADAGPDSGDGGVDVDGDVGASDGWDREARARELSVVIAFDFLIQNGDRWGGSFTNVRTRGEGGPIILLDNAAGFWRRRARTSRSHPPISIEPRLGFVERFDSGFVRRLRRLDLDALRERLAAEPLAPILDDAQLAYLEDRRQALLAHIDGVVAREGDRALPW
jgi:hypothetical protein